MKTGIIQTYYSRDYRDSDRLFAETMKLFDKCDDSLDLIVLPEYCDVPALASDADEFDLSLQKYSEAILRKAEETAVRCHALVFVNAIHHTDKGWRNTTHAINAEGKTVGRYYKAHPAPSEEHRRGIDVSYSYEPQEPYTVDVDGVRYGFLTCYDFYFYEAFAAMARKNPDVIIGCSHQRSDTHHALELITQFASYHTNAYVVRASVSLGADSEVGGCSMVTAPDGTTLLNMKNDVGLAVCEFDPKKRYLKPAGFMGRMAPHHEYIEDGRRPWNYRPAGPAMIPDDDHVPYPRTCAHRGFNTVAPENSMPAYGAAVALGAEEIEFDLWPTKDGEIVSLHDPSLDRVSTGTGNVYDHTYEELLQYDFGVKCGENFAGLRILKFEEILRRFARQTIMNIHIKTMSNDAYYDEEILRRIVALIEKYDCVDHVYFMSGNDHFLELARRIAPHIRCCVGAGKSGWTVVDRAIKYGCPKVQLMKPDFDQAMIDKAHENGIICNVFWSDDPEETRKFLDMGIDVILANDYLRISRVVEDWKKEHHR